MFVTPFDFRSFKAHRSLTPDPKGPVEPQEHAVKLFAPSCAKEEYLRSDLAKHWCRTNVAFDVGERWSVGLDRRTDDLVYSFSGLNTAVLFALTFRGISGDAI
jgi:hypothetical protein